MQDRLSYANGNTITTEGFRCSVGEPIDIKATVGEDKEVDLQGESGKNIPYGDYLITLEVNGEKAAYRDLYHLGDPVTVGDYTISDDMYLDGVSEDDEVVMRLEPVELMVTDAFRAAVKSLVGAASESSGGGSGGDIEVVRFTIVGENNVTCDHTFAELQSAQTSGKDMIAIITYNGNERISPLYYYAEDEYEEYDANYSNCTTTTLTNGKGFIQDNWFCSVTSDGVSGGATSNVSVTLLTANEISKQLSVTFTDIESAINGGASVQIKSDNNKVVGTAVTAESKPVSNQYNVYGSIIENGALTPVVWTASSASGKPSRS